MFEGLTDKIGAALKKFRGKGKLTEEDVKVGMREVKLALLEADVNFKVVKEFVKSVTDRAVGTEVLESLVPAQQIVKIVNEELTTLMGGANEKLRLPNSGVGVMMMVGLQGAGKTTHCGKLALHMKNKMHRRPLLCACDVYRPAAIKQLQVVGEQVGVPVFTVEGEMNPTVIVREAMKHAQAHGHDTLLIDTAGRLHVDEGMMQELCDIKDEIHPDEILLVIDAMLGQDAVNVATTFNEKLDLSGVILTKLDGDTRGGAALSVRQVTGKPIKFVGVGEKLDQLEPFYPDRMASRILGMGDVLSLIEKAEQSFDEAKAEELEKKLKKNSFTLDDYLDQFKQIKKMGSIEQILAMMPGIDHSKLKDVQIDEKIIDRMEAIILSMTKEEREKPKVLNASRRRRIALGSGTSVEDVNRLIKQYDQMCDMMKKFTGKKMGKLAGKGRFKMPF